MQDSKLNAQKVLAKIELRMPLTDAEYAFAILYCGIDPKTYVRKRTENQQNNKKIEIGGNDDSTEQKVQKQNQLKKAKSSK